MLLKVLVQLLALVIAFCIIWLICFGWWQIDKAAVMGLAAAQVQNLYGEPDSIEDSRKDGADCRWVYAHGLLGFDLVYFDKNDRVTDVSHGAGKFP